MKYLKKFEAVVTHNIAKNINKKYIILQIERPSFEKMKFYYLLEPYETTYYDDTYSVKCRKLYTISNDTIKKNKQQYYGIENDKYKNLIYQTNDYQDALDVFISLKDMDKYNI